MKIVIDTTMERHVLKVDSDDAMAITQSIMEKYAEETVFLTLWDDKNNKTITLRKNEIMAMFVYPDELCDYDKTTSQMIQDAVLEKEKGEENLWIDCGNSYIKMYVNKRGCLVFEPRLKKE